METILGYVFTWSYGDIKKEVTKFNQSKVTTIYVVNYIEITDRYMKGHKKSSTIAKLRKKSVMCEFSL